MYRVEDDETRFQRKMRRTACKRCGSNSTEIVTGLDDDAHFPECKYRRCTACGYDETLRARKKKEVL